MSQYKIQAMLLDELVETLKLIKDVFLEFEAPDYSEEGVATFLGFAHYDSVKEMIDDNILKFWVCKYDSKIIGVIATKNESHISMLFVDKNHHRKGIARKLVDTAFKQPEANKDNYEVTVNSSPYAIEFYHRLGFVDVSDEKVIDGIRFTPMKKKIV